MSARTIATQVIGGPEGLVIRSADIVGTAAALSVFGLQPRWIPPLPADAARALHDTAGPARQLLLRSPGERGSIRLVEVEYTPPALEEFSAGPHGLDFYTQDIDLSRAIAAKRGWRGNDPIEWAEAGVPIRETRVLQEDESFAVFLPEIPRQSRVFPSSIDRDDYLLHSELCMTSWVIPSDLLADELTWWQQTFAIRPVLSAANDADDMQVLMRLSRPAQLDTVQLAKNGYPCRIDVLTYVDGATERSEESARHAGLAAVEFTLRQPPGGAVAGYGADRGRGPETVREVRSPGGIAVEVWSPCRVV